ncbi:hypothetical protein D0Y65_006495, partial [Glycine soja]
SGEILSCTLWENYCIQFLSYLNERGDDGLMVIILTHARIKDAKGSYPASDVVCVTVRTISKIVMDNHSWCYPACVQCHRKTDIQTGPFTCGCGKDNDQPVLRYRVEVMVTQNNESSKFLLWDRECVELIGETADDVNRVKIKQSLSVTADHDPVVGFPLTTKKRMSSDEVDDELRSSQISPAQLSSNKLTRHSHKSQFS